MIQNIDNIKHSIVIFYQNEFNNLHIKYIKELLENGRKVIIFLNYSIDIKSLEDELSKLISDIKEFKNNKFLQIYNTSIQINQKDIVICDGEDIEKVEEISKYIGNFNFEQYKVEHQPKNTNISIEAGAGTGKTTVMIDRILYLLHTDENLSLDEITMITFTREATQNMRHKLQEKLLIKYKLTRQERYLKYIEQESKMNIQTIHSFAKYMISKIGIISGYGTNVKIRSFKYDRIELITKILDRYFKDKQDISIEQTLKMPLHQFRKIVDTFWNQLETQGTSYEEIKNFNWGEASTGSETIHDIMKTIFKDLECEFSKIKKKENAVSLKDITRELDDLIKNTNNKDYRNKSEFKDKLNTIKYLFIDEFQDTDNTQIKLVKWIHDNLESNIFVVGDIKQSIYRFRGATYTAFKVLKKEIPNIVSIALVKNYRTSKDILNKLHPIFKKWNDDKLLVYEKKDKLVPMENVNGNYLIEYTKPNDIKEKATKMFRLYLENIKKIDKENRKSNDKVVALVRTNYQAKKVKEWCDEEGILCYVEVGGTFFTSEPVRDLIALIGAYLFTNEPVYKVNLIDSYYTSNRYNLHWKDLWECNGNKLKLNNEIDKILNDKKYTNTTYNDYKNLFRTKPVLQVIKQIIKESNLINNVYSQKMHEYRLNEKYEEEYIQQRAEIESKKYYKNLNKLLETIKKNFSDDFCSLNKLYDYLILNMNTNRDEDEVELEQDEILDSMYCMTVHKSKGLEFHTVILPLMDRKFRKNEELEILVDMARKSNHKVGWNIPYAANGEQYKNYSYQNKYYEDELEEQEKDEVSKEEARLLYVALTRAIQNLVCIKLNRSKDTWSSLL